MKKLFVFMCMFLASMLYGADAVVSADGLQKLLHNNTTVVVDIAEPAVYQKGHIPGARNSSISQWRKDSGTYLEVRSKEEIETVMRSLGINQDSRVVIYARTDTPKDFLKGSYVFWAMKYYGLKDVSLLDGGYAAWVKNNQAVSTKPATIRSGNFKAIVQPEKIATMKYILSRIDKVPMIDARPAKFYFGVVASGGVKRAGHIKGATSYNWQYSVDENYRLKNATLLKEVFEAGLGLDKNREIIVYCTGGLETSFNYYVLSGVLGFKNVRLYDASMKQWGNEPHTPMVKYRWE